MEDAVGSEKRISHTYYCPGNVGNWASEYRQSESLALQRRNGRLQRGSHVPGHARVSWWQRRSEARPGSTLSTPTPQRAFHALTWLSIVV